MTKKKSVAQAIVNGELVDLMLETTADNVFMADGKNVEETIAATNKSITDLTKKHTDDIDAVNNKHTQDMNTVGSNLNNRVFQATVTVSGNIIKVTNGTGITKKDGMLMTFKMPSNMNVANIHINMFGANIPLKSSADNAIVDEMIGGVCYLVTYASNSFFISGGGGKAKILYENYNLPDSSFDKKTIKLSHYTVKSSFYGGAFVGYDNKIYVVGGRTKKRKPKISVDTDYTRYIYSLDTNTNTLEIHPDSTYIRFCTWNGSIDKDKKNIYVIDGANNSNRTVDKCTECFNIESKTWSIKARHLSIEHISVTGYHNGKIYAIKYDGDGSDAYRMIFYTLEYNVATNTWTDDKQNSYDIYCSQIISDYTDVSGVFDNFMIFTADDGRAFKYVFDTNKISDYTSYLKIDDEATDILGTIDNKMYISDPYGAHINHYEHDITTLTNKHIGTISSDTTVYYPATVCHDFFIYSIFGGTDGSYAANANYLDADAIPVSSRVKKFTGEGDIEMQFDKKMLLSNSTVVPANTKANTKLPVTISFEGDGNINGYVAYKKNVKNI